MNVGDSDVFLISTNTLKTKGLINRNVDDCYIQNAIKAAEDIYLVEILGYDLVYKLCSLVKENSTIPTEYDILLKTYIQDYLLFKVMAEIQIPLWGKARNEGIVNSTGTEFQPASRNDCTYTKEYYDNLALGLVPRMEKYLEGCNIPEWKKKCKISSFTTHIVL